MGLLGKGGFANTYRVLDQNNQIQAMKIFKSNNQTMKTLAEEEYKSGAQFNHENLLKLNDFSEDSTEVIRADGEEKEVCYVTMEILEGGEVFDLLAETGMLPNPVARRFF